MNCQFIWQINYSYSKGINKFINTKRNNKDEKTKI